MPAEPITILLAEDDGHAALVRLNLGRAGVINTIVHARDGQEALDYLRRTGGHAARPPASLVVLLDINMPTLDGIETLRQIKSDSELRVIPVIMLTTTDDPREVEHCYRLGCSVYVTKPVEYGDFCEALTRLGLFLQFVQVPPEGGPGQGAGDTSGSG